MRTGLMSAATATVAALAAPAGAQEVQNWFGDGGCYVRTYDARHLTRYPGQQVTRIWIGGRAAPVRRPAREVIFGFDAGGRSYADVAVCRSLGRGVTCAVEGGGFRLTQIGATGLRITVKDGLVIKGGDGVGPELGGTDDGNFLLNRTSSRACRP